VSETLADEIAGELAGLLASHPLGPTVKDLVAHLAADAASVRSAMAVLDAEGRAKMVRRTGTRAFRLVSACDPVLACKACHAEFERAPKSKRITCSKSCGVALSWRDPAAKERRASGIRAQRATPEGKANTQARNATRWARPGERERLSESNRRRWADPIAAAETAAALKAVNGSAENREKARQARQAAWDDPETRERYLEGIRRSKSDPASRERFSVALRERWKDPVWRGKLLAATRRNAKKATAASVEAQRLRREASSGPTQAPSGSAT
jgi:hypothetical protein